MAKLTGMGWTTCSVDDHLGAAKALVNDVTSLDISTPRGVQDVTGLDKTAMERLLLLSDMSLTLNGVFNPTADKSHDVFKSVPSTSVTRTVTLVIAAKTLAEECLPSDYSLSRPADGSFTWTVPLSMSNGVFAAWA
jgi:hypothetical protein